MIRSVAEVDESVRLTVLGLCQRIQRMGRSVELALLALKPSSKHYSSFQEKGSSAFCRNLDVKLKEGKVSRACEKP